MTNKKWTLFVFAFLTGSMAFASSAGLNSDGTYRGQATFESNGRSNEAGDCYVSLKNTTTSLNPFILGSLKSATLASSLIAGAVEMKCSFGIETSISCSGVSSQGESVTLKPTFFRSGDGSLISGANLVISDSNRNLTKSCRNILPAKND
jgi:hypothetical protein